MYERLTRKLTVTDKWVAPYGPQKITDRLAAYEDSGLSPEEVKQLIVSDESKEQSSIEWFNRAKELQDELNSYKQAKADGRLVVLPEPQKSDYPGLKVKYRVYKARNGEPVENCFVLRPDKDYAAIQALYAYAGSTDNVQLKEDIYRWLELIASEKEVGE